jgi:hypothetical protein
MKLLGPLVVATSFIKKQCGEKWVVLVLALLLSIQDILCSSKSQPYVADTKERAYGKSRSERLRRFEEPMI